ncbi:hypothetical protein LCI18_011708 [Fusarium solani-melongenae]|uniref:Uncharacterized protein n=1 Tax=Fusarium solani subsp. cucurbitae TaxID=2747967 RepID=A0ACD3ZL10_FUSSC|nr:hypothetical protein LCI18_011708 [Fusarium solani-melongenae]
MSGGWNPVSGRDASGARPAFAPVGAPMPTQGQPYIPHYGGPAPQYHGYVTYTGGIPYSHLAPPTYPMQPPMGGPYAQKTFAYQPNGAGNVPRQPQPHPAIDTHMPAAQMTNSSGGVGCEPGYNYFFPAEHAKMHVFKSKTPPWQLPENTQIPFIASHVPCGTLLEDLLKGFGCTNPVPKKNLCFEVYAGGNGKWYKGFCFAGDEKEQLKKTIKEVGWGPDRTGEPGAKPIVCLWFCKG